jgi:hypothetical protein
MADLAHHYGVEVYTESLPAPPPDGKDRARAVGNNGVYMLITKEPSSAEVVVSEGLRKRGFTPQYDAALRQLVRQHVARADYDGCLLASVRFVADVEKKQSGTLPPFRALPRGAQRQLLGAALGAAGAAAAGR